MKEFELEWHAKGKEVAFTGKGMNPKKVNNKREMREDQGRDLLRHWAREEGTTAKRTRIATRKHSARA